MPRVGDYRNLRRIIIDSPTKFEIEEHHPKLFLGGTTMKSNLFRISFTMTVFAFMFVLTLQLATAQRRRRTTPVQRTPVSTNTSLTNDQALRITAIIDQATTSFAPPVGEQPTQEQLNNIAKSQINDILNVLTPEQKRQIGYRVQIVDPES